MFDPLRMRAARRRVCRGMRVPTRGRSTLPTACTAAGVGGPGVLPRCERSAVRRALFSSVCARIVRVGGSTASGCSRSWFTTRLVDEQPPDRPRRRRIPGDEVGAARARGLPCGHRVRTAPCRVPPVGGTRGRRARREMLALLPAPSVGRRQPAGRRPVARRPKVVAPAAGAVTGPLGDHSVHRVARAPADPHRMTAQPAILQHGDYRATDRPAGLGGVGLGARLLFRAMALGLPWQPDTLFEASDRLNAPLRCRCRVEGGRFRTLVEPGPE
ncbi:hypothetical protein QFZ58_000696 [Streptomyces sp. B1I3]|nr:hypothetical protein [Streptomyces sp. B1I3]